MGCNKCGKQHNPKKTYTGLNNESKLKTKIGENKLLTYFIMFLLWPIVIPVYPVLIWLAIYGIPKKVKNEQQHTNQNNT